METTRLESIESQFKKLKNSGYFLLAAVALQVGMQWQTYRDFTDSQKTINARQQITNEQQAMLNEKYDTTNTELRALVAGQERRLQMLENRRP